MLRDHRLAALLGVLLPCLALAQEQAPAPAPAPGAPVSAVTAAPPATQPQTAEQQNDLRVRTLEERVTDLKEKIFRTKSRLMNLNEMVIGGDITSGSKAVIVHKNEMGSSFYLESASYSLDGAPVYSKVDVEGDLEKREEFEIFSGRVVPGNHQIAVQLVYRGHGFGVFSYLEGYKFKVQSAYTFNAEPGKVNTVKVVGFERGGITAKLEDRPAVRYDVDVQKEDTKRTSAPAPVPAAAEGAQR